MRTIPVFLANAAVALICLVGMVSPAYAYLDGGTGGMIVQLLAGGLAGVAVVGRLYWYKLKSFFVRGGRDKKVSTSTEKNDS